MSTVDLIAATSFLLLFVVLSYLLLNSVISDSDTKEAFGWMILLVAWVCIFALVVGNMGLVSYSALQAGGLYVLAAICGVVAIALHYVSASSPL